MEKKKKSPTQDIPNIYELSNKKPPVNRKRRVAVSDTGHKSKDEIRRSHAASRKKKRRIIRLSIFFFFIFAVLFSLVIGLSQVFCRIDSITVKYADNVQNSKRYYTNDQIINTSSISNGKNLLFISSSKTGEKLQKLLPYISVADVKKDFPSGIVIEIREIEKVYAFKTNQGFVLTDENGKYLELADTKKASQYPVIALDKVECSDIGERVKLCDGKDIDVTAEILEYISLAEKCGIDITSADFTDMSDVYLEYDGRIKIHIGKMSDEKNGVTAWKKLQLAKKSLDAEDKQNPSVRGTLNMTIAKKAYFKQESDPLPDDKTEN